MWNSLSTYIANCIRTDLNLLTRATFNVQQLRTTFILRRKHPPQLHKKGGHLKTLRSRHYVYELEKDTLLEARPNLDIILTTYVDGLGNAGDKVSVKPYYAYNHLLLPGLAVYASPENLEKYKDLAKSDQVRYSSATALYTVRALTKKVVSIIMNKETPWTLQPWHVRASFRKCGIILPEEAITMPSRAISGPDLSLENKVFYVTVTINNQEKVNVRCKIHHWSTDIADREPYEPEFWKKKYEPLFPEDAPVIEEICKMAEKNC